MKSILSCVLLLVVLVLPVSAQSALFIPVQDSYEHVEENYFIFLDEGNVWEYAVTSTENGVLQDLVYVRYTFEQFNQISESIHDYIVRIDFYDETKKIRQRQCLVRLNRLRVGIGSNFPSFADCNYQSPFSQQDVIVSEGGTSVRIGLQSYSVPSKAAYQHFWGDQNGDNGYITFNFAQDIGLTYFESRTNSSPFNTDPKDTEYRSELVYARIDGTIYGESEVEVKYDVTDLDPSLTPAQ